MTLTERFETLAKEQGVKIFSIRLFGRYLHIDTRKSDEAMLRQMLGFMNPEEVRTLPAAPDGRHLDGSRHHRIVAKF